MLSPHSLRKFKKSQKNVQAKTSTISNKSGKTKFLQLFQQNFTDHKFCVFRYSRWNFEKFVCPFNLLSVSSDLNALKMAQQNRKNTF
jgi:hypothetical protein